MQSSAVDSPAKNEMPNCLQQQIVAFQHWREQLALTIADYRHWLDATNSSDAVQDLRLYDMQEALKNDRLVLAFIAEFSRGKTETINALFFSDFNQRLLPSESGRTTMCPTEIFWDEREEPCIKLLPIETRKRDNSLVYLKTTANAWVKIRLDLNSADSMKNALQTMVEQKQVSLEEARSLGLWLDNDISMQHSLQANGGVDVPVWRHALINYPHPLLKSGLTILDTPGLNSLGAEPELTLSIIPNAHAVIFLLATDTGVTKSDMQIWTDYLKHRSSHKIAVLNKIDMLWDDLQSSAVVDASIQSQVNSVAQQLGLPAASVLAISAQKALLAKIRQNPQLLAKSGIARLEQLLAQDVIGAKHQILSAGIIHETGNMQKVSRKMAQQRLIAARVQMAELQGLRGQNRDAVQGLLAKVAQDRKLYDASVLSFNQGNRQIGKKGKKMLVQLSSQYLDGFLKQSRQEIGDSWTTAGLTRAMKALIRQTVYLAEELTQQGHEIRGLANQLYDLFHHKHGFEKRHPPALDMEHFIQRMRAMEEITAIFCADPLNIMTEKHFLTRKFFISLGGQARSIFSDAHSAANKWMYDLLAPLKSQISEHKTTLDQRTQTFMQVHENNQVLESKITQAHSDLATLQSQSSALDRMLLSLMQAAKPITA